MASPCQARTCGMMVSWERRSWRPMSATLTPSMRISPSAASRMRNRQRVIDDLPAPVRPTIPTWREEGGPCGAGEEPARAAPRLAPARPQLLATATRTPGPPRTPGPRAPSRPRARAHSGSSAPAPGPAGSAQSNSGTPPRPAGASPPGGGCPPSPKGPGREGKVGLHQGGSSSPAWPSPTFQSASLLRPPPSSPIRGPGGEPLVSPVGQPCGSMNPLSLCLYSLQSSETFPSCPLPLSPQSLSCPSLPALAPSFTVH